MLIKKILKTIRGDYYFESILKKQDNNSIFYHYKSPKVLIGNNISRFYKDKKISSLSEVEFQIFSQYGDDGIIQWLIQNLPIKHKTFIEFGVENYTESNTRFLLINNYWSGLVIDGSISNIEYIKSDPISLYFDLQAIHAFITIENINELILKARFHQEVGLLSIDVDGNDYWIWKAIEVINPIIVIVEYNSTLGYSKSYTIPYQPDFVRGESYPMDYWGASLKALTELGNEKGYKFIGCNSAGNNAYFIRYDFATLLPYCLPAINDGFIFGSFSEIKNNNGELIRGLDKIKNLDEKYFFNTISKKMEKFDISTVIDELENSNKLNRF